MMTFDRVLLWNPETKETRVEFQIFDTKKPSVLVERTGSAAEAEKLTGMKYDAEKLRAR